MCIVRWCTTQRRCVHDTGTGTLLYCGLNLVVTTTMTFVHDAGTGTLRYCGQTLVVTKSELAGMGEPYGEGAHRQLQVPHPPALLRRRRVRRGGDMDCFKTVFA